MVNKIFDRDFDCSLKNFSLVGAPRLLQSVAKDDIMPILKPFQSTFRNEPFKALLLTLSLSEISVLVANFDIVTSMKNWIIKIKLKFLFSDCLRIFSYVLFIS